MTSSIKYKGGLRTEAIHLRSTQEIITDAPTDNNGQGNAFSPTDLVATALGSCMLTIMGIYADKHSLNIEGTTVSIKKHMASNPRRIEKVEVHLHMPEMDYDDHNKKMIEKVALACPVAKSLHSDLIQDVVFHWA